MPDNVLYPSRTHARTSGKSRLNVLRSQRAASEPAEPHESRSSAHVSWMIYILSLPQLLMGLLGLFATFYILHTVRPEEIANLGGESVYLPLLLSVSWACFWFIAFLTQHWRRATITTIIVVGWMWLRLHDQSVFPALFIVAGALIAIELYLTNREAQA